MFEITIDTDNDAFQQDFTGEVVRILEKIIADFEGDSLFPQNNLIHDSNGNTVGKWKSNPPDHEEA